MTIKDILDADDLAFKLRTEFDIQEPQKDDEFTALWFTENVSDMKYNQTRKYLEKMVKAGRLTVRRNVSLTWSRKPGLGNRSDVYRMVEKCAANS